MALTNIKTAEDLILEHAHIALSQIEREMEKYMDDVAKTDKWDNRWTCVARAGYVNPYQTKAVAFGQWMDACWVIAIQAADDIMNGLRTIPTPEDAIAELPQMVWPT